MPLRPNLARYYCERVELWAHLKLSYSLARLLISASYGKTDRNGKPSYALYGNIYMVGGIPHVVRGVVHLVQPAEDSAEYHVGLIYAKEKWPKPPRDIKPAKILLDAISEEAGGG